MAKDTNIMQITDGIFHIIEWGKHYTVEERQALNDKVDAYIKMKLQSYASQKIDEVIGEDEPAGKHDFCTMDDNWCYDHSEIAEEGTNTTHGYRNKLRAEQREKAKQVLGGANESSK